MSVFDGDRIRTAGATLDHAKVEAQIAIAEELHRIADALESVIGGDQRVKISKWFPAPTNTEEE